jgi:hypothetical protein
MIKVKRLKELLSQVPDDADVYAQWRTHEGLEDDRGIVIVHPQGQREWFVQADEDREQEERLEGFELGGLAWPGTTPCF